MKPKRTRTRARSLWGRVVSLWRECHAGGEAEAPPAESTAAPEGDYIFASPEEVDAQEPPPAAPPKPTKASEEEEAGEGDELETEGEDLEDEDEEGKEHEEDEEDEEEGEDLEDDEEDDEDFDVSGDLEERWVTKLERRIRDADDELVPPKLQLGLQGVNLRDDAFKRFKEALEAEGDDSKAQANAAFEVAIDAVAQVLGLYDVHRHQRDYEGLARRVGAGDLRTHLSAFEQTPEGQAMSASPKLRKRMAKKFDAVQRRLGWRAAMAIPPQDYFKMAGGKVKSAKGEDAGAAETKSKRQKKRALGAAAAPRGGRSTRAGAQKRREQDPDERYGKFLEERARPFFSLE